MADPTGLDPRHTALLVLDYQAGSVPHLPDSEALVGRLNAAIAEVRAHGGHIAWVTMGFEDAEFAAIPPASAMARMATPERRPTLHVDAPEMQLHPALSPEPHDIAVRKNRVGAFSTTDLDKQLRDLGVTSIIVAGVNTSGAVLSTVRDAMDRDYGIVVLKDASADSRPASHVFLTETILARHVTVIDVEELHGLWA